MEHSNRSVDGQSISSIRLRAFGAEHDLQVLREIRRDYALQDILMAYPEERRDVSDDDVLAWVSRKERDGVFLVVVTERGPAGFVQLSNVHRKGEYAWFGIAIAASSRGRGVGRAALAGLIEHGGKLGLRKIIGDVRADNSASRAMCEGLGFEKAGTYRSHYRGHDVIIYEKHLR
jgi:RimJ/RimL family protein N-acetyltransferase